MNEENKAGTLVCFGDAPLLALPWFNPIDPNPSPITDDETYDFFRSSVAQLPTRILKLLTEASLDESAVRDIAEVEGGGSAYQMDKIILPEQGNPANQ